MFRSFMPPGGKGEEGEAPGLPVVAGADGGSCRPGKGDHRIALEAEAEERLALNASSMSRRSGEGERGAHDEDLGRDPRLGMSIAHGPSWFSVSFTPSTATPCFSANAETAPWGAGLPALPGWSGWRLSRQRRCPISRGWPSWGVPAMMVICTVFASIRTFNGAPRTKIGSANSSKSSTVREAS